MFSKPIEPRLDPNRTPSIAYTEAADAETEETDSISDYSYAYGHFQDPSRLRQPEVQQVCFNMPELQNGKVATHQENSILSPPSHTGESVVYADIQHLNNEEYMAQATPEDEEDMVIKDNELYATDADVEATRTTDGQDEVELVVEDNELYHRT